MRSERGDVVLVSFPFTSGDRSKRRPALVIQSNHNNLRLANTILVQITSNTSRVDREQTQVLIDPDTSDGQTSGLLAASAVTCETIASVANSSITRIIGNLSPALMQHVDDALKKSLELH
jgi:mRNA interferase MazF